jgi:TonB family protein
MRPNATLIYTAVLLSAVRGSAGQIAEPSVYKPGDGVSTPQIVSERKPSYTADAMRRQVQGVVHLECIVEIDGTVSNVRVVKPLDPELDETSSAALKEWRFKPGMKDGKPVRVLIEVEMAFSTAGGPRLDSADVFKPGPGVTVPTVMKEVKPDYPPSKRDSGIQGTVSLECVVLPDGRVGDTRVTGRLDPDLDREAVRALRQWRFAPGQRQGKRVPVQVNVEISFTLK